MLDIQIFQHLLPPPPQPLTQTCVLSPSLHPLSQLAILLILQPNVIYACRTLPNNFLPSQPHFLPDFFYSLHVEGSCHLILIKKLFILYSVQCTYNTWYIYVTWCLRFESFTYCDVLRYVTLTFWRYYVLKLLRTVMFLRSVTFTFWNYNNLKLLRLVMLL